MVHADPGFKFVASSLIHRYSFNETSGLTLIDSVGGANARVVDQTGAGTVGGGGGYALGGGEARLFGGANSTSDYIELPDTILAGLTDATFEFWGTRHSLRDFYDRIFDFGSGQADFFTAEWRSNSGRVAWFDTGASGSDINNQPIHNFSLTDNTEVHLTFVVDEGGGTDGKTLVTWYQNGVLKGSLDTTAKLSDLGQDNNWLGRDKFPELTADASYNEFRIYNRALTAAEIAANTQLGPNAITPLLVDPTNFSEYGIDRGDFEQGAIIAALQINGGDGDDSLFGGVLADTISGGSGKDYIVGGLGDDKLNGDGGADRLFGLVPTSGALNAYPYSPPQQFVDTAHTPERYNYELAAPFLNLNLSPGNGTVLTDPTTYNVVENAFALEGTAAQVQLSNVREVGDFNNDGQTDFIVSGAKTSYLLFGPVDLSDLQSVVDQADIIIDHATVGRPGDRFGDVNGDGITDLVFVGGTQATNVRVIYGGAAASQSGSFITYWPRVWDAAFVTNTLFPASQFSSGNSATFQLNSLQLAPSGVTASILNADGDAKADVLVASNTTDGTLTRTATTTDVSGINAEETFYTLNGGKFKVVGKDVFAITDGGAQLQRITGTSPQNVTGMTGTLAGTAVANGELFAITREVVEQVVVTLRVKIRLYRVSNTNLVASELASYTTPLLFIPLTTITTMNDGVRDNLYVATFGGLLGTGNVLREWNTGTNTFRDLTPSGQSISAPIITFDTHTIPIATGPAENLQYYYFDPRESPNPISIPVSSFIGTTANKPSSFTPIDFSLASAGNFTAIGKNLFFVSDSGDATSTAAGSTGLELWSFNRQTGGAAQLFDILPGKLGSNPKSLRVLDDKLYFTAETGIQGRQLFQLDPSNMIVTHVTDQNGNGFNVDSLFSAPDGLYYETGNRLLRFNGTDSVLVSSDLGAIASSAINYRVISANETAVYVLKKNASGTPTYQIQSFAPQNFGYVFSGATLSSAAGLPKRAGTTAIDEQQALDQLQPDDFGLKLPREIITSVVGDVNGDGRDDVAASDALSLGIGNDVRFADNQGQDVILQFGGLKSASVSTILNTQGIGSTNSAAETAISSFVVPGTSGTVSLDFTLGVSEGGFKFTFGLYDLSAVTADPITQRQEYARQAIQQSVNSQWIVFSEHSPFNNVATNTKSISVNVGTTIGFFIVPNATAESFLGNPSAFYGAGANFNAPDSPLNVSNQFWSPLFSASDANPGQKDQMLSFVGNGKTVLSFEDLTRTSFESDSDFNDLVFSINTPLTITDRFRLQGIGDINHDGFDDVAYRNDTRLQIVQGKAIAAQMTFTTPNISISGFSGDQLTATSGDYNGDGLMDLAVLDFGADKTYIFTSIAQRGSSLNRSTADVVLVGASLAPAITGFELAVTGSNVNSTPAATRAIATGRREIRSTDIASKTLSFEISVDGTRTSTVTVGNTQRVISTPISLTETITVETISTETLTSLVTKLNAALVASPLGASIGGGVRAATSNVTQGRLSFSTNFIGVSAVLQVQALAARNFSSLSNSPNLDLNADGLDDLAIGSSSANGTINGNLASAGRVYAIYGQRQGTLPTTFDELANISVPGGGSFVADAGTNQPEYFDNGGTPFTFAPGQTERWFRFRTLGDGRSGNEIRINGGAFADLLDKNGGVLTVGHTIFDLRTLEAGTYFLRVYPGGSSSFGQPIPLGNLFDDPAGTALSTAIATDTFRAVADAGDLGIDKLIEGGVSTVTLNSTGTPINFNLTNVGWTASSFANPANDATGPGGRSLRTTGASSFSYSLNKVEDGLGLNSNGLLTFDLNELRTAGGLGSNRPMQFVSERAGLNDGVVTLGSVKTIVLVSNDSGVTAGYINGQQVAVTNSAGTWSFTGTIPTTNGRTYAKYDVALPGDARYLTLITTENGDSLFADEAVFSGARLIPVDFRIEFSAPVRGQTHESATFPDRDEIHGGDGDDTIVGNNGLDRLFGESGVDQFTAEPIEVRDRDVDLPNLTVPASESSVGNPNPVLDPIVNVSDAQLAAALGAALGRPVTTGANGSPLVHPGSILGDTIGFVDAARRERSLGELVGRSRASGQHHAIGSLDDDSHSELCASPVGGHVHRRVRFARHRSRHDRRADAVCARSPRRFPRDVIREV